MSASPSPSSASRSGEALLRWSGRLLDPASAPGDERQAAQDWCAWALRRLGLDENRLWGGEEAFYADTRLETGKAISPVRAAWCVREQRRTAVFLRAMEAALRLAAERFPGERLHVVEAGCGPLAPLALPFALRHPPSKATFTLVDLHPAALASAERLAEELGVRASIRAFLRADITTLKFPEEDRPHVIACETLLRALIREPQVAATLNLAPQLRPGGIFLPERIDVIAGLRRPGGSVAELGTAFSLEAARVSALERVGPGRYAGGAFDIPPHDPARRALALHTRIRVFGEHALGDSESSLNLPEPLEAPISLAREGGRAEFFYEISADPGVRIAGAPARSRPSMLQTHSSLPAPTEAGSLGVLQLKRLWAGAIAAREGRPLRDLAEQHLNHLVLDGLGLGLQQAQQYLMHAVPSFEEFERWIVATAGEPERDQVERINAAVAGAGNPPAIRRLVERIDAMEPVLSREDLAHWDEHGYVIVHDAVPADTRLAAERAIWERLGARPEDPDSWYVPNDHGIMVQYFQHPAFTANRRSPRIHKAFAQLWGTADLWVSTDRCGFNAPERPGWLFRGPDMHWDVSLARPIPFGTQGILYLTDTPPEQGAFTCVPGFQRRIEAWLDGLAPGKNPREQDLHALGSKPIAGRAGDLVIWDHKLPHGSRPNRGARPRIVQYVNMCPTRVEQREVWV